MTRYITDLLPAVRFLTSVLFTLAVRDILLGCPRCGARRAGRCGHRRGLCHRGTTRWSPPLREASVPGLICADAPYLAVSIDRDIARALRTAREQSARDLRPRCSLSRTVQRLRRLRRILAPSRALEQAWADVLGGAVKAPYRLSREYGPGAARFPPMYAHSPQNLSGEYHQHLMLASTIRRTHRAVNPR